MGAVNIFLGGTGKAVAEDIQDSRDFYGLGISEPIAFDLNARIRDGVQLSLVAPGSDAAAGVAELAREWSTRDPGPGVGPESGARQPGPQRSPEHSLLVKIGEGITRDPAPSAGLFALRAHGLAVFSMLFDPAKAMAGTGTGNELRNHIEDRVNSQTFDGRPPRINLITSTAGGTGAGTVIPLALWLREHYPGSELNLVAVTPSAFSRVLRGNMDLDELAAKGRSGTYAILRELSFFSPAPDPQTTFSPRGLPVTQGDLAYRPGRQDRQLFDRVYWFGGRGGGPEDAFEEAGALVRLLSYDGSANDLAAETGGNPMQWVGAVTAIEYPKLRYQRRMISSVLQAAYRALRHAPEQFEGTAGDTTTLLAYVNDQTTRTLGGWFNANRHGPLAPGGSATTVDIDAADALAGRIRSRAGADAALRERVSHGTQIQGANYRSDTPGWRAYVGVITDNLDREAGRRQVALQGTIREVRREEEQSFGQWLKDDVLESRLSGNGQAPTPTDEVDRSLLYLEQNASELERHFEEELFPTEKTLDACEEEIRQAKDRFDNPPPAQASLSGPERIVTILAGVGAFAVVLAIARLIPGFDVAAIESSWIAWVVAAIAMLVVHRGTRWLLLRGKQEAASLHERRRRAEQALFSAYEERDRVRALRWMHQELRDGSGTPFFRDLRRQVDAARNAVERLASVYEALEDRATAEASQASVSPPHVVAEVGECIIADRNVAENIVRELQQRLRVDAHASPEPRMQDLTVRLVHADEDESNEFDPAAGEVSQILQALQAEQQAGLVDAQRVESRWRESVWKLINWKLGENLPEDFGEALAYCEGDSVAATRSLARKLAGVSLPRQPSVGLMTQASAPARRRVYVGSGAIEGEFNRALQAPELGAQRTAFAAYDNPIVVPALGEQIVFLDLWVDPGDQEWAPGVIGSATDAGNAIGTYYSTEPGVPAIATATETCFTVIPELLAATKLELGGVVAPLAPSVVARLLGSDLDTRGPTYAELFYLLRVRGWLRSAPEGDGPEAREVTSIVDGGAGDGRTAKLVAWRRGGLSDQMFGAGRDAVVMFDAFCEFIRFRGTPVIAGASRDSYHYPGADLFAGEWAGDPEGVAALQRSVVMQWYEGDVDADCDAMIDVLEQDLARMSAGPERSSWERAMRRLLGGEERRAIRATHLDRPSG